MMAVTLCLLVPVTAGQTSTVLENRKVLLVDQRWDDFLLYRDRMKAYALEQLFADISKLALSQGCVLGPLQTYYVLSPPYSAVRDISSTLVLVNERHLRDALMDPTTGEPRTEQDAYAYALYLHDKEVSLGRGRPTG